jgi:acetyltransferase
MKDEVQKKQDSFKKMFYPNSIAVVGASSHSDKTGNYAMRSALDSGLERIYPVNAGGKREILGKKAYPSIEDIPDNNVDLFLFVVPQQHILPGLKSAIDKGCRTAVIYTAGFREIGPAGEQQQIALRDMANEAGVKIIGPNTMGYLRSDSLINATFMPAYTRLLSDKGDIAIISQSGGVASLILNQFMEQHLPLGTLVCLGNRANVDFTDFLDYFADDPHTSIIALYVEGLEDLRQFYQAAARCALKKPVLVLCAGYTEGGQKVACSHTGSMINTGRLYQTAFKQAGLLQVNGVQELADTIKIIKMCPKPKGNRVALIAPTIGPVVLAVDILEQGGLKLAELSDISKKIIVSEKMLPSFSPVHNPIDLTAAGYYDNKMYLSMVEILARDPNVDGIVAVRASSLGDDFIPPFPRAEFKEIMQRSNKPAAFIWLAPVSEDEEFKQWMSAGVPAYPTPGRAATSFINLTRYSQIQQKTKVPGSFMGFREEVKKNIQGLIDSKQAFVLETQAKQIIELSGIKTAVAVLATNEDEAIDKAAEIGYPVALKVVAKEIIHKSDVGGVVLNLHNDEEVRLAFRQIVRNASESMANAGLQGVAVQPMLPEGLEVIVGAVRDIEAGPVVMFGLGGIWVEALKDVSFRLAPVTPEEAKEMIKEIKGYTVIKGFRGQSAIDTDVLADLIVKISHLIDQFPIKEIELNPVIFYGESQYAVADARIIL